MARSFPLLLVPAGIFLAGCNLAPTGPLEHESRVIDRDSAERVKVELRMGAGLLKVRGGAQKLLEADFTYNVPAWRPSVTYRSTGSLGTLTVEQPSGAPHVGNTQYEWDLALNDQVPLDFGARFGAGEARLSLGDLALRTVDIEAGAGRLDLDLRGNTRRDFTVNIRGGVGEANLHLPREAGLYVAARGGLGAINARGLRKEDDHWVNDAPAADAAHIRVDVQGGIGAINVIAN